MSRIGSIVIGAKCAIDKKILSYIERAGLSAAELHLSDKTLDDVEKAIAICKEFNLRYAVHAPTSGSIPEALGIFTKAIKAEAIVFHNIYWEDEWEAITAGLKDSAAKLCIENTYSIHEYLKFQRRFGLGLCLDLEHLQLECAGLHEDGFLTVVGKASHVHMTGYVFGSGLWHAHIHHSLNHNMHLLDILERGGYSGLVISEARESMQTPEEFIKLSEFYNEWKRNKH